MKKQTRSISLVLGAALILSLMLSATFVITHAEHDCTGDGCEICHQIQLCEQMLEKDLLTAGILSGFALLRLFYILFSLGYHFHRSDETLVSMKVKLSC